MNRNNKDIQSIFNFVTVRSPKKANLARPSSFVSYDPNLQSTLYFPLVEAVSAYKNDVKTLFGQVGQIVNDFSKNGQIITTNKQLTNVIPENFLAFSEWLAANQHKLSTKNALEQINSFKLEFSDNVRTICWDNLICYSVLGQANAATQSMILALKAHHFLQHYGEAEIYNDANALQKLAACEVVLPSEIFPLPSIIGRKEPVDTNFTEGALDLTALKTEILLYENAIEELQTYYSHQKEIVKNTFEVDNTGIQNSQNDLIDKATIEQTKKPFTSKSSAGRIKKWKKLSENTRLALTNIKAHSDLSIPFIIKGLQKKADAATRTLWENVQLHKDVVNVGGALWVYDGKAHLRGKPNEEDVKPYEPVSDDYDGFYFSDGQCRIRPLGVADFRRVEQELCCYMPGEVAHIENVLQGEYKERTTRRLRRSENTFTQTTEREEETQRDTSSTDRYELQRETAKTIQNDMSFDLGVTAAGSYGPVSVSVSSNFSTATSSQESDRQAVAYGKEVTDRSLKRVIEKVREERITKVIEEFEENNKHGLDNRNGKKHVVGLYRWADKIYKAQIVNYGKRLMFEFMIPEPAAFHLWAMSKPAVQTNVLLKEPIDPRSKQMAEILGYAFKTHTDITVSNYALLAAQYGATIDAPPPALKAVEKNYFNKSELDGAKNFSHGYNDLTIPQGYNPARAEVLISMSGWGNNPRDDNGHWNTITVGDDAVFVNYSNKNGTKTLWLRLSNEVETLPVNICGRCTFYSANVNVVCEIMPEYFETWQIKTFKAVIDAYENQKAAYEQAVSEAKIQRGVDIQGTNPAMNRLIEQQELKKGCLGWLNNGQNLGSWAVWHYNDNNDCNSPVTTYSCNTIQETERAKFFEQGFDWKLMTYTFLPYFWGNKCRWRKMYQLDDTDPLFLNFLQAGMAKVLIPVRPGFEKQVMHFLRTGQIWQGSEVPAIDSPIYLSIVEELKEPVGVVEGEPWEIRVPTALTVLQCNSGCVEGEGLPCNCGPEDGFGKNTEGVLLGMKE